MTDCIVMNVSRSADGRWQVEADDGSVLEGDFASQGSAARWIADRADLSDQDARSVVMRASPRQRTIIRAMLDEIDGGGAHGQA